MTPFTKISAIVLAVALSLAVEAGAVDETAPAPAPKMFVGQVVSVDAKAHLLKASSDTEAMTFQVPSAAKIVGKEDQPVALGDLKTGEKISVTYTGTEPNWVASRVVLTERAAKPPAIEAFGK